MELNNTLSSSPFASRGGYRGVLDAAAWSTTLDERDSAASLVQFAAVGARVRLIPGDTPSISLSNSSSRPPSLTAQSVVHTEFNDDDDDGGNDDAEFLRAYRIRAANELRGRVTSARDAARGAPLVTQLTLAAHLPTWANSLLPHITGFVLYWDGDSITSADWRGALRGAAALVADGQFPWQLSEMRANDASNHFDVLGLPAGAIYRHGNTVRAFVRLQDEIVFQGSSSRSCESSTSASGIPLGNSPHSIDLFKWLCSVLQIKD